MKNLLRLLVICCFASRCLGSPSNEDSKIRARFNEVVQAVVGLDANSLVGTMHRDSVKSLAEYFRAELERRGDKARDAPSLSNESFIIGILTEAFRASPATFAFPEQKSIRVHGIVHDGPEAFLVYSTASEVPGFTRSATLTFRQINGEWKLWGIPLTRLVVGTWHSSDQKANIPPGEQGVDGTPD
jgi:hypothetical protein